MIPCGVMDPDGPLWVYELPEDGEEYVIGLDAAEGKIRERSYGAWDPGRSQPDFNAMSVCRVSDGIEAASYLSHFAPGILAEDAFALGRFYRDALIVPEINGPGFAVLEALRDQGYPRLYVTRIWNHLERAYHKTYGWRTTPSTRPILIRDLQDDLRSGSCGVRCRRTAQHLAAMRKDSQGKDQAPPGGHDDLAFARALALQGRRLLMPSASRPAEERVNEPGQSSLDRDPAHFEPDGSPDRDSILADLEW